MAKYDGPLTVTIKDTDLFREIIAIVGSVLSDERIDETVRKEYNNKLKTLTEHHEKGGRDL